MKKTVAHIFFLLLLFTTAITHAAVVPHEAIAGTTAQEGKCKSTLTEGKGGSHLSQDITITDWDEYDEFDIDEPAASKQYLPTISPVRENLLASFHNLQSDKGKIYTYLNFSRLPRHNYISLRVLRI